MKIFDVYTQTPIEPVRGSGCYLWDSENNKYLDMYGGHAVISVGHAHPDYVKAISDQAGIIGFYSNAVLNSLQNELAELLGQVSGYKDYQLFLCNSGAEANENAMKTASFVTGKKRVIAFEGAFHGRTSGAVSVTDNPKIISPFNTGHQVTFVHLNDSAAVEKELSAGDCAAVIIEGIQGVAGICLPSDEFLMKLRELTVKYGAMLIIDEVQSGYGRTGKFFAHQHTAVNPDLITIAKGMGNGFPIGGVLISPAIKPVKGMLGSTFGGSHLACTAAKAVLEIIVKEDLMRNASETGGYLINKLTEIKNGAGKGKIKEIRGRGLMIGIEMEPEYAAVRDRLLFEKKIFTGYAKSSIIRLLPPLPLQKSQADHFLNSFESLF